MNKGPRFLYKIVLTNKGVLLAEVDWGNHPQWQEGLEKELADADRIWLVPKESGGLLRNVSVKLGEGRRWILFSRVYGSNKAGFDKQVRIYALGWQDTKEGVNRKSIVWIYPSGEMEVADEPSFGPLFLDMV